MVRACRLSRLVSFNQKKQIQLERKERFYLDHHVQTVRSYSVVDMIELFIPLDDTKTGISRHIEIFQGPNPLQVRVVDRVDHLLELR